MSDSSRARRQRGVVAAEGGETAGAGDPLPASAASPLLSPTPGVWDLSIGMGPLVRRQGYIQVVTCGTGPLRALQW